MITVDNLKIKANSQGTACCSSCSMDVLEEKGVLGGKFYLSSFGALVFVFALIFNIDSILSLGIFLVAYILIGGDVLFFAIRNLFKGKVLDENFLMSIATVGAFFVGDYAEGVAVMLFYKVGEFFQDLAVRRSRKSIKALMDIKPEFANLKIGGVLEKVDPSKIRVGDFIVVKPGERVALDGIVTDGNSSIDTSALTGESIPRDVANGCEVLSGSINQTGVLTLKVTKSFSESTVSKILDLVENASKNKAKTEHFITKFSKYYTPFVVLVALFIASVPPLFLGTYEFKDWIYRGLVFLVVSCPCALVISIPLSFFGGIGGASRNGILVKGGNFLEALNTVDTVIFDKTGTLTDGSFKVSSVNQANGFEKDLILKMAGYIESFSNHPIALSIVSAYGDEINQDSIFNYEEVAGFGVKGKVDGSIVLVGNFRFMEREKVERLEDALKKTCVYVAIDGIFAGSIEISDSLKKDSKRAVDRLRRLGVDRILMFTGDNKVIAEKIGLELGLDGVYSQLLPQDKVKRLEEIFKYQVTSKNIVFVGDGINDSPSLARADIGIAMGGVGSDAAIEASDIVLMQDNPLSVAKAMIIAKRTRRIVMQNIVFSLGVKALVMVLAVFGLATMWGAVFADVGVTLIAVINAMRALKREVG